MGSFYGGGAIMMGSIGGGGNFSGSYNDLTNVPIKNLTGSETKPIDVSTLDTGIYKVEGPFKYGDGETNSFVAGTELYVTTDKETGDKVSIFYYVENGELKAQIATLSDPVEVKDMSVTGNSCDCNNAWVEI